MSFNKIVVPSEAGNPGLKFAEFLGVDADEALELTDMMSVLYDRLYRLGAMRNLDGTRAYRRRAREREAAKRRRGRNRRTSRNQRRTARTR